MLRRLARKRVERGQGTSLWDRRVEIRREAVAAWNAGASLDASRRAGLAGAEPVQWSEVEAYCRLHRLTGAAVDEVCVAVEAFEEFRREQAGTHAQSASSDRPGEPDGE